MWAERSDATEWLRSLEAVNAWGLGRVAGHSLASGATSAAVDSATALAAVVADEAAAVVAEPAAHLAVVAVPLVVAALGLHSVASATEAPAVPFVAADRLGANIVVF